MTIQILQRSVVAYIQRGQLVVSAMQLLQRCVLAHIQGRQLIVIAIQSLQCRKMLDAFQTRYAHFRYADRINTLNLRLGHVILASGQVVYDPLAEGGIREVGLVNPKIRINFICKVDRHIHGAAACGILIGEAGNLCCKGYHAGIPVQLAIARYGHICHVPQGDEPGKIELVAPVGGRQLLPHNGLPHRDIGQLCIGAQVQRGQLVARARQRGQRRIMAYIQRGQLVVIA